MLFKMQTSRRLRCRWCLPLLALLMASPAMAQLRLPGGLGGGLPTSLPGGLGGLGEPVRRLSEARSLEQALAQVPLQALRQSTVTELLRRHGDQLEADAAGEPVVRGELLLAGASPAQLDAARALGFRLLRVQPLDGLDDRLLVLAPPRGRSLADAAALLRALDPTLTVDFNHLYTRSGTVDGPTPAAAASGDAPPSRVGLIDGGVDRRHPALRALPMQLWGCDGQALASQHGTAVASLLLAGEASGAAAPRLFAADIYCDGATGGATAQLAGALAWMAREQVPVVNISLVGPANRVLERAVRALVERGHLLVAAVGNDGPAAPPLFPAAYPGVVGVTGVGAQRRVLPEAAQGPQVAFAAQGAELLAARAGERGHSAVRGTSFAAPQVARLLARLLPRPDAAAAQQALLRLQAVAIDLGTPGRDEVYGWGLAQDPTLSAAADRPAATRP